MQIIPKSILTVFPFVVAAMLAIGSVTPQSPGEKVHRSEEQLIAVAPPPFSEGIFPCSDCHMEDDDVNRSPREVDFHDTVDFKHASDSRWCLDCHDTQNRDMLHLADGRLIPFEESYLLCGQCHAQEYKNWRAGDHGRRTGSWSGAKEYLLCAHCHDPHNPEFKPMAPLAPPIRQENIR